MSSEGFTNAVVGGAETLIRAAIKSVNYVAGLTGWRITRAGDADFNSLTARGSLTVADGTGAFVELSILPGLGPAVFVNPPDYPAVHYQPGYVTAQQAPAAGSQPQMVIQSPYGDTGGTWLPASLSLTSATSAGAQDNAMEVSANQVRFFGRIVRVSADLIVDNTRFDSGALPQLFIGTGMQDVSGLDNIVLQPGAEYSYELHVAYDAAAATDAKFAWTSSGVVGTTVPIDRCILAPTLGAASNINTAMQSIRRAISTQQQVGGCAGVANAFTVYHEWGVITNTDSVNTQTITFQAAEVVAGAGVTVQGHSWLKLTRHV